MRRALIPAVGLGLLATPLASCAVVKNLQFERPALRLESVQLTGLDLAGGSLNLVLDVFNPNGYAIRTLGINAAVDLEETHFGDVALERDIVLSATQHTTVEIPVTFTWAGVGAGARALLQRGAVNYTLDSRLSVSTPIGERTVAFRDTGNVPLRQALH
jgi:LEA14-like dessication related protein